jgi:putative endonuclease
MKPYYVYILTNPFRTVLYIGVTSRLCERLLEHRTATEEKKSFAGRYNAQHLIFFEEFSSPTEAIQREKELKGWRRERKEALIAAKNPNWDFLEYDVCG